MSAVHSPSAWHRLTDFKFPSLSTSGLQTCSQAAAVVFLSCQIAIPAIAQQRLLLQEEDPETERRFGLWLDQAVSTPFSPDRSLEFEFHQRLDDGASNLFEYFFQGGMAFRLRPWLTLIPIYRYQRYPGDVITPYENRLLLNITLTTKRGRWQPILRTLTEGRFPNNRIESARFRIRPGFEYALPLRMKRPPVAVINNEFFVVPGANSFAAGGKFTQNRLQAGVRLPITDSLSIRPYYLRQWVNLPTGWENNGVLGISIAVKLSGLSRRVR
jgi:hypothetical protein